jgi:hypothetical protein
MKRQTPLAAYRNADGHGHKFFLRNAHCEFMDVKIPMGPEVA